MRGGNKDKTKKEFDEALLEVRRVTRVTTWWRRMSFRATVLVGNRKGKIWLGSAKGPDVSIAVQKASREAYKNMFIVPLTNAFTVPYPLTTKYKSCLVKLLPAAAGTGLKAGSSIRSVLELAGYENVLSKMVGSNNKLNNALTTIKALSAYKHADHFGKRCQEKKVVKQEGDEEMKHEEVKKPVVKTIEINNKAVEVPVEEGKKVTAKAIKAPKKD